MAQHGYKTRPQAFLLAQTLGHFVEGGGKFPQFVLGMNADRFAVPVLGHGTDAPHEILQGTDHRIGQIDHPEETHQAGYSQPYQRVVDGFAAPPVQLAGRLLHFDLVLQARIGNQLNPFVDDLFGNPYLRGFGRLAAPAGFWGFRIGLVGIVHLTPIR